MTPLGSDDGARSGALSGSNNNQTVSAADDPATNAAFEAQLDDLMNGIETDLGLDADEHAAPEGATPPTPDVPAPAAGADEASEPPSDADAPDPDIDLGVPESGELTETRVQELIDAAFARGKAASQDAASPGSDAGEPVDSAIRPGPLSADRVKDLCTKHLGDSFTEDDIAGMTALLSEVTESLGAPQGQAESPDTEAIAQQLKEVRQQGAELRLKLDLQTEFPSVMSSPGAYDRIYKAVDQWAGRVVSAKGQPPTESEVFDAFRSAARQIQSSSSKQRSRTAGSTQLGGGTPPSSQSNPDTAYDQGLDALLRKG